MDSSMLFWTQVSAIGQAVGALATAAAVIVALWIALSERRPNIKLRAGLRLIIPGDGSPATDVVAFEIENRGMRTVRISGIGWQTGWTRRGPDWLRQQLALQNPNSYSPSLPFDLAPGQRLTVYVEPSSLGKTNIEFFTRKLPFQTMRKPANVRAVAHLVACKSVIVKVEKPLSEFLATGKIERGAARFNKRAAAA